MCCGIVSVSTAQLNVAPFLFCMRRYSRHQVWGPVYVNYEKENDGFKLYLNLFTAIVKVTTYLVVRTFAFG